MTHDTLTDLLGGRGVALLGCGKMGTAMLEGWLAAGLSPGAVLVIDPSPSDRTKALCAETGATLAADLAGRGPDAIAVAVIAVKPQMMDVALPTLQPLAGPSTLIFSIAAGTPIARFAAFFGPEAPIVRAMPNTPASIGKGISALVAGPRADARHRALAERLASAVGETLWIEQETDIDAVTAVSGSGPAYVFHMIEALAAAGVAEGLPQDLAMRLARATVTGAGALAAASDKPAEQLRVDVTSPGGTTAAGLEQLMDAETGLPPLMRRTIHAAAKRSRELAG